MRVFVTGAAGRLGATIVSVFDDMQVLSHTRASLDITDPKAVSNAIAAARPDVIINCAAFNDVDGAEGAPLVALAVNAFAPRHLARAARRVGAAFVHYSTDFVFDGKATRPYDETVPPSPQSTYAASKLPADAKRIVTFLRTAPATRLKLPIVEGTMRMLATTGREVFSAYAPHPKAPEFMIVIEKTLGKDVTTRTWATIQKCVKA